MLSAEWETVRITANHYSHGPVQDVTSENMTCYQRDVGTGAAKTVSVQAGGTVTFTVDTSIGHPGPLQFYMAKAPSGQTAATFDGKGPVWFKIYQDGPEGLGTSKITWPSDGALVPLSQAFHTLLTYPFNRLHPLSSPIVPFTRAFPPSPTPLTPIAPFYT